MGADGPGACYEGHRKALGSEASPEHAASEDRRAAEVEALFFTQAVISPSPLSQDMAPKWSRYIVPPQIVLKYFCSGIRAPRG